MKIENDFFWVLARPHWQHDGTLQFLSPEGDYCEISSNASKFSSKKEALEWLEYKKMTFEKEDLSDYEPVKVVEYFKITKQ